MLSLLTGKVIVALLTLVILFIFGIKVPQGILAIYLNGLFIATLLLTDTGIPFFAGGSILVVTAISLAYYLVKQVGFKAFWERLKGLLPLLAVLIAVDMMIAYFYGTRSSYGLLKIVRFLSINLFFFFGIGMFSDNKSKLHSLIKYTAYIGLAYSLSAVLGMWLGSPNAMYGWNNRIWFSRALGLTLIMFYYLWGIGKAKKNSFMLAVGVFMLFMMFLAASRGPVLALYLSLFTFELFDFAWKSWGYRALRVLLITLLFLAFFSSQSPFSKPLQEASESNNQRIAITEKFSEDKEGTANERIIIWKATLKVIQQHPVWGVGTGSVGPLLPDISDFPYRYPLNLLLEVMVEQGIPGLILWSIFLIYSAGLAIRKLLVRTLNSQFYLLGLALLVNGVANAMVSGDLTDNSYIFVAIGLIWATYLGGKKGVLDE
ncbi:MAG: O-antigen ligase family protein [Desulfitobacteriaceae bacterium]